MIIPNNQMLSKMCRDKLKIRFEERMMIVQSYGFFEESMVKEEEPDLIITTGGLGPTEDDLTKETAAEYFGERLILDERALGRIRKYFDRTGRVMTENNVKQANGAGEKRDCAV